jgi:hypothetical protein
MATRYDPSSGLNIDDEDGRVVDPEVTGSDVVTEGELGGVPTPGMEAPTNPDDGSQIEMGPDDGGDGAMLSAIEEATAPGEEVKPGESKGTGGSVGSSSGVTASTAHGRKAAGGYFDRARADAAAESDGYANDINAAQEKFQSGWDKRHAAIDEVERVTREHHTELSQIAQDRLTYLTKQQDMEERAALVSQAQANKYMQGYEQDMLAVRQLNMQSGNPLGGLGGFQKLSLGAAAFAQGFLGARYGINVNVTGQVDNWVKQEMDHHQRVIANAKDIAQSNLTLYGLARQNAKDDWEARERLRGLVIDGLKTKVVMEANRFHSDLAKSDAMEKVAQLEMLAAQTKIGLRDKIMKETHDTLKMHLDAANQEFGRTIESRQQSATASYQNRMAKVAEREQTMKENKENKVEEMTWTPISDPSTPEVDETGIETNSGLNRWMPDENADKENRTFAVKKAAEYRQAYKEGREAMDELIRLRKGAEKVMGLPAIYRERDENYMLYKANKDRLIGTVQKAMTGLSFTEGETKKWEGQVPDEKIFGDDMGKMMYNFSNSALRQYNSQMSSMEGAGLRKIRHDELQKYGKYTRYENLDESTKARNKVNLTDDPATATSAGKEVASVREKQEEPASIRKVVDEALNEDVPEHPTYLPKASKPWKSFMGDSPQPFEAEAIDRLARGVLDPEGFHKAHPEDKDMVSDRGMLRKQLLESLGTIATGERVKPEIQRYAATLHGYLTTAYDVKNGTKDERDKMKTELWGNLKE